MLPARGTVCIFSHLCSIVTKVCFAFYFLCTPSQTYTPLNHFFQEYVDIYLFLFVLYLQLVGSEGAFKYYQLEVQLAYLVNFTQFLLWFAPHLTLLHSKLQSCTPWNHFLQEYFYMYFFLFGLVSLAGRILRGLEDTSGQRYSLHIQSTLPNF